MNRMLLLLTVTVLAFSACSKNDKETAPTTNLHTKIIGKWLFTGNIAVNGRTTGTADSFIEFLDDSTYSIYDSEGQFFTGKFSVKDSNTIALGDIGTLRSLRIVQGVLNCILTYDGREIRVEAAKVASMPLTDSTKLICRSWLLANEYNGTFFYNAVRGLSDGNGNSTGGFKPDSIVFQLTPSGTYLVHMFKESELRSIDVFYWKWHASTPNYWVTWYQGATPDQEVGYEMQELNANQMIFRESADLNGDGVITENEISRWKLIAVGK